MFFNLQKPESCLCLIFLFSTLFCRNGLPQTPRILTLEQTIEIALNKSVEIKKLKLDVKADEQNLIAAKGKFRTNADMSLSVPSFYKSFTEIQQAGEIPNYNTIQNFRYQGTLRINQPLFTDGKFTLRSDLTHRDFHNWYPGSDGGYQETKFKEVRTSVGLEFQQPLFTINRLKTGQKKAELNYELAAHRFKRTEWIIIYEVTLNFYQLYRATRQVEINEAEVRQQGNSYKLAKMKYEAGLIPEVDALQLEVDLAESKNNLLTARTALQRQNDYFKQLIGLDLDEAITIQTDFKYTLFEIDQQKAIEQALKNRNELHELEIQNKLSEINVKEIDSQVEFRGDLYAFYDLTGVSSPFLDYNSSPRSLMDDSWDNLKDRPRNKGVVFSLTIPLWDWGVNAAQVEAANASLRQTGLNLADQKKTITREIRNVVNQVRKTAARLEVLKKSEALAQRQYDISLERFNNGDMTSEELASAQSRLTTAKMSYLDTFIEYQLAVADLKQKTLWDFERGVSLVK